MALDQVQVGSRGAAVVGEVAAAVVAGASMAVVGIAQGFVVLGLGNFPVENQVRLVFRPRSAEP